MTTKQWAIIFTGTALLSTGSALFAAGVAFVTNLTGEAKVENIKLALMSEINKGARVVCTKDCTVGVMYLQSGKEYVLKGPGDYLIGEISATAKIGTPPMMRETQWRVSDKTVSAAQSSSASVRMRSISGGTLVDSKPKAGEKILAADRLLYPIDTLVSSLQPEFRWKTANEKGPFNFELTNTANKKSIYKVKATAPSLKLPGAVKLQADTDYVWSVHVANNVLGEGNFHTLPAHSLELALKRKPDDKAEFSDWLLYALTLQDLGAGQDAREILATLAKSRPDLPELLALAK